MRQSARARGRVNGRAAARGKDMKNRDHGVSQAEQRITQGDSRPLCATGTSSFPAASPARLSGPWVTLLRIAWLAIALGLLLQLALLLVAAGFGAVAGSRAPLAETLRTVSWSLLVCVGVALGRVAAKGRVPLEGVTGLLGHAAGVDGRQRRAERCRPRPWTPLVSQPVRLPCGSWPSRQPSTAVWAWRWSGSAGEPGTAPLGTWRSE